MSQDWIDYVIRFKQISFQLLLSICFSLISPGTLPKARLENILLVYAVCFDRLVAKDLRKYMFQDKTCIWLRYLIYKLCTQITANDKANTHISLCGFIKYMCDYK